MTDTPTPDGGEQSSDTPTETTKTSHTETTETERQTPVQDGETRS